ncbi:class II aldolase/adducin family protein [Wenjunlia tyrosinilytica]|uniref:Class II aldolase/adducin family protein n=1 Tax=Wenjunlia tyrosinilytica TaxID=1544741 RepID=A0A917ZK62_9ACTN|nr:class II aldolase/adducin family protein [Wenjunlia tyrosinilytica]GGO83469.1 class II aldolase/adducin family protein [Wenjunlia tyrosinilytica]
MTDTDAAEHLTPIPTEQLRFELPPSFDTVGGERRHRKERLAAALRLFARLGFDEGVAGHITVRDPQHPDHFWVNPFGVPFPRVKVSDLILADSAGHVVEGRYHVNQAAFVVHAQVHAERPDVVAVAHSHTVHGRALAALGEPLEPITQDACAFFEDHEVYTEYTDAIVDEAGSRLIARALGPAKAIVLRNHGLLTVGTSVDAAAWWFIAMERACQVQLAAKAAGRPVRIAREDALRTREQLGGDLVAWINYQPMFLSVAAAEPDLFQ